MVFYNSLSTIDLKFDKYKSAKAMRVVNITNDSTSKSSLINAPCDKYCRAWMWAIQSRRFDTTTQWCAQLFSIKHRFVCGRYQYLVSRQLCWATAVGWSIFLEYRNDVFIKILARDVLFVWTLIINSLHFWIDTTTVLFALYLWGRSKLDDRCCSWELTVVPSDSSCVRGVWEKIPHAL